MYIKRAISKRFREAVGGFPAVLITGPRQSGKTTFLINEMKNAAYITFDDPMERAFASEDPRGFIAKCKDKHVVLDEVQYVPELFSYLKMEIDTNRRAYGKWIMTGSQQFNVMKNISDSLAGRVAILNLSPFHYNENTLHPDSIAETIWRGGYPEIVIRPKYRDTWLSGYLQSYIERDVRQIIQVQDILQFQTFMNLCAANNARELNYASLSRDTGLSQPAIKKWVSVLVASFIIHLLPPYYKNFGKRLIKSPKMYFIDQALASYLTRHKDADTLFNGAMAGMFFESFIVTETVKILQSKYGHADLYFWRSHDGLEVDLIIEKDGKLHPVEIKKTATPTTHHAQSLIRFRDNAGPSDIGTLKIVHAGENHIQMPHGIEAVPWRDFLKGL